MFVGVSVIEIRECNKNMAKTVKDFFLSIISFQHVLHYGVGRSEIEWNMKIEILICTGNTE